MRKYLPHLPRKLTMMISLATLASTPMSWAKEKAETPTPEAQVKALLQQMTQDEKIKLVYGYFGAEYKNWDTNKVTPRHPQSIIQAAGYLEGVPRLNIPDIHETDAGLGVASQPGPSVREATSLPSGLATAASWDTDVALKGGEMIGSEAKAFGFNVMLAGAANLTREPLNGRNFEYPGEDPLLAGKIAGAHIRGIQSNNIVSTLKHFALNAQETNRNTLNAVIEEKAFRESDLLAFQIALKEGNPGAVMCAYNKVNGYYSCESEFLLNQVLKKDWGFKGFVMSDWGATHSTVPAALNGLDQESAGEAFDLTPYFNWALKEAVNQKWVPESRLDDMAGRVLYALIDNGVMGAKANTKAAKIDVEKNEGISRQAATQSIVLLKNDQNVLPLGKQLKSVAVVGGYADKGVLAGGGSSKVYPRGGLAVPNLTPADWPGPVIYFPSSPLKALQKQLPNTQFSYTSNTDVKAAVDAASKADVVVVFANQWVGEDNDARSLNLPDNQDQLISELTKANKKVIVVIQAGSAVAMPWVKDVAGIVHAWYPGSRGGDAIADILTGAVNPSGHLPMTFPVSLEQTPRPQMVGDRTKKISPDVNYIEGANVGYKWFEQKQIEPLFPFGYGLSYTSFDLKNAKVSTKNGTTQLSVTVTNTGSVKGAEVVQVYADAPDSSPVLNKRLVGWQKVQLKPKESKTVDVTVHPEALMSYNTATKSWTAPTTSIRLFWGNNFNAAKASQPVVTPLAVK